MLDWAIGAPPSPWQCAPGGAVVHRNVELLAAIPPPRFEVVKQGSRVALIGAGTFFTNMAEAAKLLEADGIEATLINPAALSALDTETLDTFTGYDIVITAEDGTADGGFRPKSRSIPPHPNRNKRYASSASPKNSPTCSKLPTSSPPAPSHPPKSPPPSQRGRKK